MALNAELPEPIRIDCRSTALDDLMETEWLVTNKLGSHASSTVVGANTRRYHGLLVAATLPPVGRQVVLSALLEQLVVDEKVIDLSTFRFAGAFSPAGYVHLVEFINDVAPTWIFQYRDIRVTRQLVLAEQSNSLAVRYKVEGDPDASIRAWPFTALRDFHSLRQAQNSPDLLFAIDADGLRIEDRASSAQAAHLVYPGAEFVPRSQWWYRFQYPVDIRRGQEGFEDLYTPGYFAFAPAEGRWVKLLAGCQRAELFDFDAMVASRRRRLESLTASLDSSAGETSRRLAIATDAFVASRDTPSGASSTIVAGYHWFGDWGRDTFIAFTGTTLLTKQFDKARQILRTFASAIRDGMVPNRFDDYGNSPHYNSIDASLWFVQAVDRYIRATGDEDVWSREFIGPVGAILRAYHDGTQFHIHADADGLVSGGSGDTQLTWMDVKFNGEAITPRHGKAVEINALWLEAQHIMAERCRGVDDDLADYYAAEASRIGVSFVRAFWFDEGGYLYDCVSPEGPDESIRPNQAIALAMPHCPLDNTRRLSALRVVREHLLTPVGLRTLSNQDSRYRGVYGNSWESRDRAYHQGTVWPWLMGHFVQAHLLAHDFSDDARRQADQWLAGFDERLRMAGLGTLSEIHDGNAPHADRGCIAQAWSVAEVLRARLMVEKGCLL